MLFLGNRRCWMLCPVWQEIARLMMEQEKKEYKKIREREKERERDRERAAMEKMAMERRRHEADYRVGQFVLSSQKCVVVFCFVFFFPAAGMEP